MTVTATGSGSGWSPWFICQAPIWASPRVNSPYRERGTSSHTVDSLSAFREPPRRARRRPISRRASCRSWTESCAITSAPAPVSGFGGATSVRSSWARVDCATLRSFTGFCAVTFCSGFGSEARAGWRGAAGRGGSEAADVGGRAVTVGGEGTARGAVAAAAVGALAEPAGLGGADAAGGGEIARASSVRRVDDAEGIDSSGGGEAGRASSAGGAGGCTGIDSTGGGEAARASSARRVGDGAGIDSSGGGEVGRASSAGRADGCVGIDSAGGGETGRASSAAPAGGVGAEGTGGPEAI